MFKMRLYHQGQSKTQPFTGFAIVGTKVLVSFVWHQCWLRDFRTWHQMPVLKMVHLKNKPKADLTELSSSCAPASMEKPRVPGWQCPSHRAGTVIAKARLPCDCMGISQWERSCQRARKLWDGARSRLQLLRLPPKPSPCLAPTSTV